MERLGKGGNRIRAKKRRNAVTEEENTGAQEDYSMAHSVVTENDIIFFYIVFKTLNFDVLIQIEF